MRQVRALILRTAAMFGAGRTDAEIREELEMHRSLLVDEYQRSGLTPEAARHRAAAALGNLSSIADLCRDQRGIPALETAIRNIRFAGRQLLKSPAFTLVAVVGLALGIGANVAVFSVVNSVLLQPLPYGEPDRLVRLASTDRQHNLIRVLFSYSRFLEVQQRQQVFTELALSAGNAFTLTGRGDPEQVMGLHASAAMLPALGLQPAIGRNFSPDEDRRGGPRVVLISQQAWRRRFNAEASVLGQVLVLDVRPTPSSACCPTRQRRFRSLHGRSGCRGPPKCPTSWSRSCTGAATSSSRSRGSNQASRSSRRARR